MKSKGSGNLAMCVFLQGMMLLISSSATAAMDAPGTEAESFQAAILATYAAAEDLSVQVRWKEQTISAEAEIVLFDEHGVEIDKIWIWPTPGESSSHTLVKFFKKVPEKGFQFFAVVRDAQGVHRSRMHALRVFFDCSDDEFCDWRTVDGLEAGSLVMRQPLMESLEAVSEEGSVDLLADVLQANPELVGQVTTLAAQLDHLDRRLNLGETCSCTWNEAFELHLPTIRREEVIYSGNGSRVEVSKIIGEGATLAIGGQASLVDDMFISSIAGYSALTLELRCRRIRKWHDYPVPMSWGAILRIRFPELIPCADICSGEVDFSSELKGSLAIGGRQSTGLSTVEAKAFLEGGLTAIDWTRQNFDEELWEEVEQCSGTDCWSSTSEVSFGNSATLNIAESRKMEGRVASRAGIVLYAAEPLQRCIACSLVYPNIFATGTANCALEPETSISLWARETASDPNGSTCGELAINPWAPLIHCLTGLMNMWRAGRRHRQRLISAVTCSISAWPSVCRSSRRRRASDRIGRAREQSPRSIWIRPRR